MRAGEKTTATSRSAAPGAGGETTPDRPALGGEVARGPGTARRATLWVVLLAAVVLAADQVSKALVRHSIALGGERKLIPGLLALVHTDNQGVAFGVNPGGSLALAILIALAVVALLVYFARHATRPWLWLPTGMLLGGALGNVIDRVRLGAVTDFVKLPLGWPPFNLADASITIGVLILVLLVGFEQPRRSEREEHGGGGGR